MLGPLRAPMLGNQFDENSPQILEHIEGDINAKMLNSFSKSFNVDAKGVALQNSRQTGLRVIIPPKRVSKPTSITCKIVSPDDLTNPPFKDLSDDVAIKIVEMTPSFMKFNGPIKIEVPH